MNNIHPVFQTILKEFINPDQSAIYALRTREKDEDVWSVPIYYILKEDRDKDAERAKAANLKTICYEKEC